MDIRLLRLGFCGFHITSNYINLLCSYLDVLVLYASQSRECDNLLQFVTRSSSVTLLNGPVEWVEGTLLQCYSCYSGVEGGVSYRQMDSAALVVSILPGTAGGSFTGWAAQVG
jgi:hypothetical protein